MSGYKVTPNLSVPLRLVHWMPWTGNPTRVNRPTGYVQTDLAVIDAQVRCMKAAGFGGVIAWWQGPANTFTHTAFTRMFYACLHYNMAFIPALDQWIAKNTLAPTSATIKALTSDDFQSMVPFFAERWVLEFDLARNAGVDVAQVQAAVPGLTILSKHVGYSWPEVQPTIAATLDLLATDNSNPQMRIPAVFSRFSDGGYPLPGGVGDPIHFSGARDNNRSVWGSGPARVIEERAGSTYLDTVLRLPATAKYSGLATWNDYDEGTQHEPEFSRVVGVRIGV